MPNGLDPEYLVIDDDGFIVPSELFIPTDFDTIDTSQQIINPSTVSPDNAAVEIRPDAIGCLQTLSGRTKSLLWFAERQHRLARMKGDIPKSNFSITPAAELRPEHMDLESVSVFGCAPSLNLTADLDVIKQSPEVEASEVTHRSAGFHVHYSDGESYTEDQLIIRLIPTIQVLDALIGLVDVMMNDAAGLLEASRIRRDLLGYGNGGEFRIANLHEGHFEYRTLSPWPLSHPIWTWWAGSAVRSAFLYATQEKASRLPDRSEILDVIRTGDTEAAMPLWLASVAAVREIGINPGNNSLARRNLAKLHHAIVNGGHTYYTAGDHPYKAWRFGRLENESDRSEYGISPKIRGRRRFLESYPDFPLPGYLDPKTYRRSAPRGSWSYFPSGTDGILNTIHNLSPVSLTLPETP